MVGSAAQKSEPKQDGRLNRSVKTKAAIAAAFVEMVDEGNLAPTSEQVALRAGVGHRTVFRHFQEMESLYSAIRDEIFKLIEPILTEISTDLPLEERIKLVVRQRIRFFKRITMFRRALIARYWTSPALQELTRQDEKLMRVLLLKALPECAALPQKTFEAADLLLSFESWTRLKELQRLSDAKARAVIEETVTALITGAR